MYAALISSRIRTDHAAQDRKKEVIAGFFNFSPNYTVKRRFSKRSGRILSLIEFA